MNSPRQPTPKGARPVVNGGKGRSMAAANDAVADANAVPDRTAMFKKTAADPVVKVDAGPATIFVIQDGRVRMAIEWPHKTGGTLTVPLKAVSSSEEPQFVVITSGLLPDAESLLLARLACPRCMSPDPAYPCCPANVGVSGASPPVR